MGTGRSSRRGNCCWDERRIKMIAVLVYFKMNRPLILYVLQFFWSAFGKDFCVDAHEEYWSVFVHVHVGVGATVDSGSSPDLLRWGLLNLKIIDRVRLPGSKPPRTLLSSLPLIQV